MFVIPNPPGSRVRNPHLNFQFTIRELRLTKKTRSLIRKKRGFGMTGQGRMGDEGAGNRGVRRQVTGIRKGRVKCVRRETEKRSLSFRTRLGRG